MVNNQTVEFLGVIPHEVVPLELLVTDFALESCLGVNEHVFLHYEGGVSEITVWTLMFRIRRVLKDKKTICLKLLLRSEYTFPYLFAEVDPVIHVVLCDESANMTLDGSTLLDLVQLDLRLIGLFRMDSLDMVPNTGKHLAKSGHEMASCTRI